jgi:hypothetical protein
LLTDTDVSDDPRFGDATAYGCVCEGWGVGAVYTDNVAIEGSYRVEDDLQLRPRTAFDAVIDNSNPFEAKSTAFVYNQANRNHTVKLEHHVQRFAKHPKVWQINVTITNQGPVAIKQLDYVRAMDWDIHPTSVSECVDLIISPNAGPGQDIYCVSNFGVNNLRPSQFSANGDAAITYRGECARANGLTGDLIGSSLSPADRGAAFQFRFQDVLQNQLPVGGTVEFTVFYGAADNSAEAANIVNLAELKAYSYGFPNSRILNPNGPAECSYRDYRYIFGFGGIKGDIIDPTCEGQNCFTRQVQSTCGATSASVRAPESKCASLSFDGQSPCHPQ